MRVNAGETDATADRTMALDDATSPIPPETYHVSGVSRPGGHSRIRCNATDVEADTESVSGGLRPGPAELLCASLAACLLKNIERFSEMLPFGYQLASVDIEAERNDTPPRMSKLRYQIKLVTDEPAHRVELLHRNILKFGTITNTLAKACDLSGEITALPTTAGVTG